MHVFVVPFNESAPRKVDTSGWNNSLMVGKVRCLVYMEAFPVG